MRPRHSRHKYAEKSQIDNETENWIPDAVGCCTCSARHAQNLISLLNITNVTFLFLANKS